MSTTKFENLINPEVLKQMISAELPSKIKFASLLTIDTTLQGQAGDTVTIPSFQYIGDAEDLLEGIAMETVALQTSTKQIEIKEAGKAVEITDKAILSGFGDPIGEAKKQLLLAIQNKIDNDTVEVLQTAALVKDLTATSKISYGAVVDGVDVFAEEDDEAKILFIHPNQKATLRKDDEFMKLVDNAYVTGTIGEIAGCQVVASAKVPVIKVDGVVTGYENFIVKAGAVGLFMKQAVEVETDRDVLARTNVVTAFEHYGIAITDESKVVRLKTQA